MNNQDKLIIVCIGILCALFLIIGFLFTNANQFYTGAYNPVMARSQENKKASSASSKEEQEEDSQQPSPRGLRERDIKKKQGDRYSTF